MRRWPWEQAEAEVYINRGCVRSRPIPNPPSMRQPLRIRYGCPPRNGVAGLGVSFTDRWDHGESGPHVSEVFLGYEFCCQCRGGGVCSLEQSKAKRAARGVRLRKRIRFLLDLFYGKARDCLRCGPPAGDDRDSSIIIHGATAGKPPALYGYSKPHTSLDRPS